MTNYTTPDPTDTCLVKNDGPYIFVDIDHLRKHKGILFRFKEGNSFLQHFLSCTYLYAKRKNFDIKY